MAKKEKNLYPMPVEVVTHKDKRVNIPTEELRDFVKILAKFGEQMGKG